MAVWAAASRREPVGAILVRAGTYALRQNGMHRHISEVAERALADGSQVLRLIVADSGADLAARLRAPACAN